MEQAGGGHRQKVNIAARPYEQEEPRQAIELSLRHPGLPVLDPTATSDSESESEGAEADLPEEQVTSENRQKADAAARPHEDGELFQALDPPLCCPGLLYLGPATTSDSELEPASYRPSQGLPGRDLSPTLESKLES